MAGQRRKEVLVRPRGDVATAGEVVMNVNEGDKKDMNDNHGSSSSSGGVEETTPLAPAERDPYMVGPPEEVRGEDCEENEEKERFEEEEG